MTMLRQPRCSRVAFLSFALLIAAAVSQARAADPTPENAGKVCVAVLEPEVQGDLPEADRKAMKAELDTILTEMLSKRKDMVLVDRQALDKVLAEKKAKIAAGDVEESLRPFWAAGILVCSAVNQKNQTVIIEAVCAQTGQRLAGIYAKGKFATAADVAKLVGPKAQAFATSIATAAARTGDKPLLEISGKLNGGLLRLAWMVEDLSEFAGAKVDASLKAAYLVPRQPMDTKEERLLRVMGLADARKGDAVAGLSPLPQIRLSFELTDSAQTGVVFEKTPITLKLSLRRGQEKPVQTQLAGDVGHWEDCRGKAANWLLGQLSSGAATAPAGDDDTQRASQMAQEELSALSDWSNLTYWSQKDLDKDLRVRITRRALRAAHLDPTSELAAYLVGCNIEAAYNDDETAGTDRVITECRRYLDRFGPKVPDHHHFILQILSGRGMTAMYKLTHDRPRNAEPLSFPPDERIYNYARYYVRALADRGCLGRFDERYNDSNDFDIFGYHLVKYLVPNCPKESLDEEYAWWKEFYRTTFAKAMTSKTPSHVLGSEPPAPWDLVESAFAVRRKDVATVRASFQTMARTYPKKRTRLWGGDNYTNYIVPNYLKAAGDPQWRTWEPEFSARDDSNKIIRFEEMTAFMNALRPRFPSFAPDGPTPRAPGRQFVVPETIRELGRKKGSSRPPEEVLLLVDGEAWISLPGPWADGSPLSREPSVIYRGPMPKENRNKIQLSPEPLPWPPRSKDASDPAPDKYKILSQFVEPGKSGSTVWIGTDQGLVRFDHSNNAWKGRWYTQRDGFPCADIRSIVPARLGKNTVLLLNGWGGMSGSTKHVFTLDTKSNKCTILFDGNGKDVRLAYSPAAKLRDGRIVLLDLLGLGVYGDVNLEDITEFTSAGSYGRVAVAVDKALGKETIWEGLWDGPARTNYFRELSASTANPEYQAFRSERITVFPFEPIRDLFGEVIFLDDPSGSLSFSPYFYTTYVAGVDDTVWIAAVQETNPGNTRDIYGYRPAVAAKEGAASSSAAQPELWIGPLASPDNTAITNFHEAGSGQLIVTTHLGSYLVSCSEMVEAARKAGRLSGGDLMRDAVTGRLSKAPWQVQVPAMIVGRQWDKALITLKDSERGIPPTAAGNEERTRLRLWRAHVLARMPGGLSKGIDEYLKIAQDLTCPRGARLFASMSQVYLLHKAQRFEEMLALVERVSTEFPQAKPGSPHSSLDWYVQDARKRLPASQPSQPAGPTSPGRTGRPGLRPGDAQGD